MRTLGIGSRRSFAFGSILLFAGCSSPETSPLDAGGGGGEASTRTDTGAGKKEGGTTSHKDAGHDVHASKDSPTKKDAPPSDSGTRDVAAAESGLGDAAKDATDGSNGMCDAYAVAECNFLQACTPAVLTVDYGTLANCVTSFDASCARGLAAPGSGFTAAAGMACATLLDTYTAGCASGPVPLPVPTAGPCTFSGSGPAGAPCGIDPQCASGSCDISGQPSGRCAASAGVGASCGPGSAVSCAVGLQCGSDSTCAIIVAQGATCDRAATHACSDGLSCVYGDGGATSGTCEPAAVTVGAPCSPSGVGLPNCWGSAGVFCGTGNVCEAFAFTGPGSICGSVDGGANENVCINGSCLSGACVGRSPPGGPCALASGICSGGSTCVVGDGGAGTCVPFNLSPGDAGLSPFTFSPTNVNLATVYAHAGKAAVEDVSARCTITTDAVSPSDNGCLTSPIVVATQEDGSTINLIVVQSLTVESTGGISVTATAGSTAASVPLVIVSLTNVSLLGSSYIAANSASTPPELGPGGAPPAAVNAVGGGLGGGAAAGVTSYLGGGGGGYCGFGGQGGGGGVLSKVYGNIFVRPLAGGSAGGGGGSTTTNGGAGGGALQIVAAGSFTMSSGSSINAGGEGGAAAGVDEEQNAGGGGSGGAILVEAPVVTLAGTLAANGGGGGGGNGTVAASGTSAATAAAGGAANGNGASGGSGTAATALAGSPGKNAASTNSGGGGGGAGRIRVNSTTGAANTTGGTFSPAITTVCATQGGLRPLTLGP